MDNSVDIAAAKDVVEAWKRFLLLNIANSELAKDEIRKYLRRQPKQEIKNGFSDKHTKVLEWAIEYLGLPTEDYEVCQAIKEVIDERKSS